MKKIIPLSIFLYLVFTTNISLAQIDTTLKPGWNPKGVIGIGLTQVALSNWQKGGENVISISGFSDFAEDYFSNPWILKNRLLVNLGSTKTGGTSFRTNDNGLLLENVLIRKIKWAIEPFIANTVRTGILNGYDYELDPPVQKSAFFDPGYITQSMGFTFYRTNFSTRTGLAFQETFTNKFRHYSDDLKTPDKKEAFKFQTGLESVTDANFTVAENMLYTTRLRLFSAFNQLDVWDVGWENTITAKVNSFLDVNLSVILLYEKLESPKTQIKEGLNVGISYTVF